jgi:hypothetical protein
MFLFALFFFDVHSHVESCSMLCLVLLHQCSAVDPAVGRGGSNPYHPRKEEEEGEPSYHPILDSPLSVFSLF